MIFYTPRTSFFLSKDGLTLNAVRQREHLNFVNRRLQAEA